MAVKDRICFNDRSSVCKYISYLDRDSQLLNIRFHGDYIRGVCTKGSQCPFAILFSRRGRIDYVCSDYHRHDHSLRNDMTHNETAIKLCHLESDILHLRLQREVLKRQLELRDIRSLEEQKQLRTLENKICYRVKRCRVLRSRLSNSGAVFEDSDVRPLCTSYRNYLQKKPS
ncbi:hypothetical protein WA538_001544 [Blastocystis sp. DL]